MADYRDRDLDGIIEEFSDEMEYSSGDDRLRRDKRAYTDPDRTRTRLLLSGMAVLIIVLIVALYFALSGQVNDQDLKMATTQLEETQDRLNSFDERIASVEERIGSLEKSLSRADNADSSFSNRLDILTQEVSKIREEMTSVPEKEKEKEEAPAVKEPEKEESARYHIVRKGETPYSIARKYGMSVKQLIGLNDLGKNPVIHPGQKLLIGKKGTD